MPLLFLTHVGIEMAGQVLVAEAHEMVLAAQEDGEQARLVGMQGVEPALRTSVMPFGSRDLLEQAIGLGGIIDHTQRLQIAGVGLPGDLGVAVQVGHAFEQQ